MRQRCRPLNRCAADLSRSVSKQSNEMSHTKDRHHRLITNESVLLLDEALIEEESGIKREGLTGKEEPFRHGA